MEPVHVEKLTAAQLVEKNFLPFMEPEGSLLSLRELASGLYELHAIFP
jgi:hypothetical protein